MQTTETVSLSGTVAVVTGGGRGIGHAITNKLADMDATVVLTGRDDVRVKQVAADFRPAGTRPRGSLATSTDLASVDALGEHLRTTYGRVDILVNNAGIGGPPGLLLHELPPDDWEAIFNTNLRGVYYMMRAVVPLMIAAGAGHVINISSLAGKNPAAARRSLLGLEVGLERAHLWRRGRIARPQHSGQRDLSGIGRHRLQSATSRQGYREDVEARRRCSRRRHAGHPGAAVVHQRGPDPADAEALICPRNEMTRLRTCRGCASMISDSL